MLRIVRRDRLCWASLSVTQQQQSVPAGQLAARCASALADCVTRFFKRYCVVSSAHRATCATVVESWQFCLLDALHGLVTVACSACCASQYNVLQTGIGALTCAAAATAQTCTVP